MRRTLTIILLVTGIVRFSSASAEDANIKWLSKEQAAAQHGDADAQTTLGLQYSLGVHGMQKDGTEAVKWWRKAAQSGKTDAQVLLGNAYLTGTGISKDQGEAVKWWRKAAESGNADGQALLGQAYYEGISVEKDKAEGISWLRKAAENGSPIAITLLKSLNIRVSVTTGK